jgi:hypothetical protein
MEHVQADGRIVKKLGHWTAARALDVRGCRGAAVLDLRSARIPAGDIDVHLALDRTVVTLLVPDDAQIDTSELQWAGRGRLKDWTGLSGTGRCVRLTGSVRAGEIRIHRGGIAILSALFSRAFVDDCIRAYWACRAPTVADPSAGLRTS